MEYNEQIVYLLRKTTLEYQEIKRMEMTEWLTLYSEVVYQERLERWEEGRFFAVLQGVDPDKFPARPERFGSIAETEVEVPAIAKAIALALEKGVNIPNNKIESIRG